MPEDSLIAEKTIDINSIVTKEEESFEEKITSSEKSETETEDKNDESNVDNVTIAPAIDSEECVEFNENIQETETEENDVEVVKTLLNELINCIVFKNEMNLSDETMSNNDQEEEIEVLESVSVESKKNIIDVDLIEKLDDEEDDIVYQRKTPSPVVLIPPVRTIYFFLLIGNDVKFCQIFKFIRFYTFQSKIKQEPVDEMESPVAVVDQTVTNVVASIDGNVEMIDAPQVTPSAPSRIKITFNKPITVENTEKQNVKEAQDVTSPPEEADPDPLPLRPKKPRIAEREMTVYLPCVRGTEVSGLCSIM